MTNVTFAHNISNGRGGAAWLAEFSEFNSASLLLVNCTVVANADVSNNVEGAGGIANVNGFIRCFNNVIARNQAGPASADDDIDQDDLSAQTENTFFGTLDGNPRLGPLKDNGGLTPTMAPRRGSPVIDAGDNNLIGEQTDQRGAGFSRKVDGDANGTATVDQGAMEFAPASGPVKFIVVNSAIAPDNRSFSYDISGQPVANAALDAANMTPVGVASTADGSRRWVLNANKNVFVYDASGGLLGSWKATSLKKPTGITVVGNDVFVVSNKTDSVLRYAGAAALTSGSAAPTSSFALAAGNVTPQGIAGQGSKLWVVDDNLTAGARDTVFVYNLANGNLISSWNTDAANTDSTDLTVDPSGASNNLWIVDNGDDKVYQYDNGKNLTSGDQSSSSSFDLAAGNSNPQGIADPLPGASGDVDDTPNGDRDRPHHPRRGTTRLWTGVFSTAGFQDTLADELAFAIEADRQARGQTVKNQSARDRVFQDAHSGTW
jgi:hypothetical protein